MIGNDVLKAHTYPQVPMCQDIRHLCCQLHAASQYIHLEIDSDYANE